MKSADPSLISNKATSAKRLLLTLRTARHLQPSQVLFRLVRRFQPTTLPPQFTARIRHEAASRIAASVFEWGPGSITERMARANALVQRDHVTFLNETRSVDGIDWSRRVGSHLWSFNLQYFDFALDLAWAFRETGDTIYASKLESLVRSWISATTRPSPDAWSAYTISLRTANWLYAWLLMGDALSNETQAALLNSTYQQLRHLERNLELQHLGNHYEKNLYALALGGLVFDGPEAVRWRNEHTRRLWEQVQIQVLPDGGHYERSPMYHAVVLFDLLQIVALHDALNVPVPADVRARIRKMVTAHGAFVRTDAELFLLNDSANGIAPPVSQITPLAARSVSAGVEVPSGHWALPESGYFGFNEIAQGERFIIDCGIPAVPYQTAHAHCDLLSFELDLFGRPFIVDSGVAGYAGHPLREYVRSTRAHNTVTVDHLEQSEMWDTFRVARRAIVEPPEVSPDEYAIRGSYRPYSDRNVRHIRQVRRRLAGNWEIADRITGASGRSVQSFLHFHPAWSVVLQKQQLIASCGEQIVRINATGFTNLRLVRGAKEPAQGWYCPRFGVSLEADAAILEMEDYDGRDFGWIISAVV
jgi:hypothetical protein